MTADNSISADREELREPFERFIVRAGFTDWTRPERVAWSLHEIQSAADAVVSRVNEWDDRTSPDDFPEALLITSSELHRELVRFAEDIGALSPLPSPPAAFPAGKPSNDDDRPLPIYGQIPWKQLGRDVMDVMYAKREDYEFDQSYYPGHQMVPQINFNSLARIVDKYRYYGLASPPPVQIAGEAWQPIETCPKIDDAHYFLFNELWEVEGWANVERAYWFEHTWIFDSGLTLLDCDTKFNPTMWHPDTTPAAPVSSSVTSTLCETVSQASYCALCDLEHPLHKDAQGFHHVVKGARIACAATSTQRGAP